MKYSKWIFILTLSIVSLAFFKAESQVIISPYDPFYYNQYQPFNGPMRGPNSIEGHKYSSFYPYTYPLRPY